MYSIYIYIYSNMQLEKVERECERERELERESQRERVRERKSERESRERGGLIKYRVWM